MTDQCSVEKCERPSKARTWCSLHYTRWRRNGDPLIVFPRGWRGGPKVVACKVDDCDRQSLSFGWCDKHYYRWRRHGDPLFVMKEHDKVKRFWSYVQKTDTCWMWTGPRGGGKRAQYGYMSRGRNAGIGAHRFSYELHVGPIPPGLSIDHLCWVTLCVNPDHLEPVTLSENTRRQLTRGHPLVGAIQNPFLHPTSLTL